MSQTIVEWSLTEEKERRAKSFFLRRRIVAAAPSRRVAVRLLVAGSVLDSGRARGQRLVERQSKRLKSYRGSSVEVKVGRQESDRIRTLFRRRIPAIGDPAAPFGRVAALRPFHSLSEVVHYSDESRESWHRLGPIRNNSVTSCTKQ